MMVMLGAIGQIIDGAIMICSIRVMIMVFVVVVMIVIQHDRAEKPMIMLRHIASGMLHAVQDLRRRRPGMDQRQCKAQHRQMALQAQGDHPQHG